MTAVHTSHDELVRERRGSLEYQEGYAEARRAFLIGQAVRERRLALGLSQVELATRAAMTQPALSRLEAGGVARSPCWRGSPQRSTPISSFRSPHTLAD
jgi:ribosome-binding protein aMBF1 (putative translation factor)